MLRYAMLCHIMLSNYLRKLSNKQIYTYFSFHRYYFIPFHVMLRNVLLLCAAITQHFSVV